MRVLLTGASGFVGSHMLATLFRNNILVALLKQSTNEPWRIKKYLKDIILVDNSSNTLKQNILAINRFSPDTLIHLAWYGAQNSFRNDRSQIQKNLKHSLQIFNIAQLTGIKTIIGLGSQAEYGPRRKPISERASTRPTTLYGVAKLCSFQMLNLLCRQHNIRFSWVRLFSAYGPMDNPTWLIPMIILKLLKKDIPELTRGEQQWDYLYVDDVCNAILSIAANNLAHGIFNLGSGKILRVRSIAEKVRDLIDPSLPLHFGKIAYSDDQIMYLRSKNERLGKTTGWAPKTNINEGLEKTVHWFKKHAQLFNS